MNTKTMIDGLDAVLKSELLLTSTIKILLRIKEALQDQLPMENMTLTKSISEGSHWLQVVTNDGKQAAICIESMKHGPIVNETFLEWAKEEIERQEIKDVYTFPTLLEVCEFYGNKCNYETLTSGRTNIQTDGGTMAREVIKKWADIDIKANVFEARKKRGSRVDSRSTSG